MRQTRILRTSITLPPLRLMTMRICQVFLLCQVRRLVVALAEVLAVLHQLPTALLRREKPGSVRRLKLASLTPLARKTISSTLQI